MQVYCNGQKIKQAGDFYYPNGQRISLASQDYYPNGQPVSRSGDHLYPNGNRMQMSGRPLYMSGRPIILGERLFYPNGNRIEVAGACYFQNGARMFPCPNIVHYKETWNGFRVKGFINRLSRSLEAQVFEYRDSQTKVEFILTPENKIQIQEVECL